LISTIARSMDLPSAAPVLTTRRIQAATWRSGYAADCKSLPITRNINHLNRDSYQDILRTEGEPDNRLSAKPAATTVNGSEALGRIDRVLNHIGYADG
jgi:hypothetical protein